MLPTKTFTGHLEDLRKAVIWSLAFFVLGIIAAVPVAPAVLSLVKAPVERAGLDPDAFLRVIEIAGGFSVATRIILWTGLIASCPFIIAVVCGFVFPGLTHRERKTAIVGLGSAAVLFAAGVCMGYFMTLPLAVRVMLEINAWMGINADWVELKDYVVFALRLLLVFGLVFELPVIVVALGGMNIVNSSQLRDKRRHVIVGLLILAAILTPPDPFTQVMMALPLILLYELCILLVALLERRRARTSRQ